MSIEVGSIVEGKVTGITAFGAFIQLEDGRTGLVHISEVADEYVKDVSKHLQEGQTVKVKVISVDKNGKVSLSIKKTSENQPKDSGRAKPNSDWRQENSVNSASFEDRLSKFLKDSDERIHDLKRNMDSKRSGGYSRRSAN